MNRSKLSLTAAFAAAFSASYVSGSTNLAYRPSKKAPSTTATLRERYRTKPRKSCAQNKRESLKAKRVARHKKNGRR